ncbi:hypothetical protein MMC10_003475 [Thelotrema lepadinum]|nr:hypothetical protein [Thelotrema lepadinum]
MAAHAPKSYALDFKPQSQSPLFSTLPGEIRNLIYQFVLSEYEDSNELYDDDTCYKRPGYFARRRTDTTLLRTCQRIYCEAWFIPWSSRQHTIYFTAANRKPERQTTREELASTLETIYNTYGEGATEMSHVRVIPQLYMLEDGQSLGKLLAVSHFNPNCFTITLRHTDWWNWETDEPLRINSRFVNRCLFPDSVTELRMELESIERRRPQIEHIAQQMREKWMFRRRDGALLKANAGGRDEIMKWEGSSTWNGQRWLRDETKPETLEYYMQTVCFRVSPDSYDVSTFKAIPSLDLRGVFPRLSRPGSLQVEQLEARGIGSGLTATEVYQLYSLYGRRCQCVATGKSDCGKGLGASWVESNSLVPYCQNCQASHRIAQPDLIRDF